jgi:NADH dehydrogenase
MSALGSRPNAVSTYHRTKWQAEQAVRQSGLTYTIFRPSIIHGPDGEFMQMVKHFACKRLLGVLPWMPYFGAGFLGTKGAGRLQPVWVQDVARCFVAALSNSKTENQTYPIGGPDAYGWPQIYTSCKQRLPNAKTKNRPKAVPVWYAKIIAGKPGVPFNRDQVIMSQEDSVCQTAKVQMDLQVELASFDETFASYADQVR